jgi:two-component system, cell cycle sensor histidine kinase PleC
MTHLALKQRVEQRDRLVLQAENLEAQLQQHLVAALARGDLSQAEAAAMRNERQLRELTENLRIYQAELHAQADELAAAHARSEQMLTRFAALFSAMPVAALLVGFNGELVEFNSKATLLFGLRQRASVVRFLHRMVDSQTYQDRVRPAFHEARNTGASALEGVPFIGEDGRCFIGELHIARLPSGSRVSPGAGRHVDDEQFTCAVIDRTEHLQDLNALQASAQALRQSEASLADSARLARTGGWELQLYPRQLRWSPELQRLFDMPEGQAAGSTLQDLLALCSPGDRAAFERAVAAAEAGQAFEIELDMRTPSGRPLHMLAAGHAAAVTDGGAIERVSGVFQDISQQAEARNQIDDLTQRLSLANDAGGIGVWDWNLGSGELICDERLDRLLGLAACAVPSRASLVDVLGAHLQAEDIPLLAAAVDRALQRHEPLNLELRRRASADSNGQPGKPGRHWLHITGRAHFDAQGQPLRLVGCAWDSSPEHEAARLRAAKESAESASRAKSAFLSRMSHELRTPLNAILGFSQLMRMEAEAGDLVLKPHRVTLIETAARHLLDLVNEVLDVSRIESGHVEVKLAGFELQPVLAEVMGLLQGLASGNCVSLHDQAAVLAPLPVLADRLRLKEVLINLISNAIKYNQSDGRVDVTAWRAPGNEVRIRVVDTGRGLDAEQLAGMFQPFNRLGAEATGVEGTGMGLFVSRRFMELMGGSIEVNSQPGQGTVFELRLNAPVDP